MTDTIDLLLQYNALGDLKIVGDKTLAHMAAEAGAIEVIKRLISVNASCLKSKDSEGQIPLHLATKHGHFPIVDALIGAGCGCMDEKRMNGDTPIIMAAGYGKNVLLSLFMEKVDNTININFKNQDGYTALLAACFHGHHSCVDILCKQPGIDVNARTDHGESGLYWSCSNDHIDIVQLLLDQDGINIESEIIHARPDFQQSAGDTALHVACRKKYYRTAKLLTERGANIYAINSVGETPLSILDEFNRLELINISDECTRRSQVKPPSLGPCPIICPITTEVPRQPCTTNCGHTYELEELVKWRKQSNGKKCPKCRSDLGTQEFRIHTGLLELLQPWIDELDAKENENKS